MSAPSVEMEPLPPAAITPERPPPTLSDSPEAQNAEEPSPAPPAVDEPATTITLLLPTGKRYPYTINAKYLRRRKDVISVSDDDPSKLTVYNLKLLLLHDWKEGMSLQHSQSEIDINNFMARFHSKSPEYNPRHSRIANSHFNRMDRKTPYS
jgi:hypothetical protein